MPLQVFVGFVAMMTLKVAIGPQNAFVLRQGIRREYVLVIVALCGIADGALIAAGVGGFAALIHAHPNMTLVARFGGAAFLIGYALLAARNAWRPSGLVPSESGPAALIGVVQMCLVVTFLNPHVYLDTVVLIGALANEESDLRWFSEPVPGPPASYGSPCWDLARAGYSHSSQLQLLGAFLMRWLP